jgi:hypothetical protein
MLETGHGERRWCYQSRRVEAARHMRETIIFSRIYPYGDKQEA